MFWCKDTSFTPVLLFDSVREERGHSSYVYFFSLRHLSEERGRHTAIFLRTLTPSGSAPRFPPSVLSSNFLFIKKKDIQQNFVIYTERRREISAAKVATSVGFTRTHTNRLTLSQSYGSSAVSSKMTAPIADEARTTEEYAAAFDLEVWKAQQQMHFRAQLRQAKEKLESRVRKEMRDAEQRRMADLDNMRQEMEKMARRLQAGGELLEKRTMQLEAREAAFEARRVKVAEHHEAHLFRVEERARQSLEESLVAQDALKALILEKDSIIAQLQAKVQTVETEYDMLQRKAVRVLSEHTQTDGSRLREMECTLSLVQTQLADTQRQLRETNADARRCSEEKLQLEHDLQGCRQELRAVAQKYHKLTELSQTKEWARLRDAQEKLDMESGGCRISSQNARGAGAGRSLGAMAPSPFIGREDPFFNFLTTLKEEITAGIATISPSNSLPFTVVEQLPSSPSLPGDTASRDSNLKARRAGTSQRRRIPSTTEGRKCSSGSASLPLKAAVGNSSRKAAPVDESHTDIDVSVSAVSTIERSPTNRSTKCPSSDSEVVVDISDSLLDSSYVPVDTNMWTPMMSAMEAEERDNIARSPALQDDALPPFAPGKSDPTEVPRRVSKTPVSGRELIVPSALSPTPEEFIMAHTAPVAHIEVAPGQSARDEMRIFVNHLRMNRQKLLETGVYSGNDDVVKEMDEKIKMYEDYLDQFFQKNQ